MPPDVREVFNLPELIPTISFWAAPPQSAIWGISPSECAVVAARKNGVLNVSRLSFRHANAGEESRVYADCDSHTGAGHRREHGDLQRHQRRLIAPAAVR